MTHDARNVSLRSFFALLSALGLLLCASSAFAAPAPNLSVSITPPGTTAVYAAGSYGVRVANIGNRDAGGVVLTIQLPKTGTSPQVYVMGTLVSYSTPACALGGAAGTLGGTRLVCALGTVKKNNSKSVSFTIELPEKTGALVTTASATTTTPNETNPGNNGASATADLSYYANSVPLDVDVENRHCTGTGLSAYFECTKFPSSISSHLTQFHGGPTGGTITIPNEPTYGGGWTLSGEVLTFHYTHDDGSGPVVVANFAGRGVPNGCFEGLTTFLGSPYVSPYEVCLP